MVEHRFSVILDDGSTFLNVESNATYSPVFRSAFAESVANGRQPFLLDPSNSECINYFSSITLQVTSGLWGHLNYTTCIGIVCDTQNATLIDVYRLQNNGSFIQEYFANPGTVAHLIVILR
ncbi:hypothetical protein BJY01DRAFT_25327 [Aspergillus pseudoustus]|uniref:BTB domain-containing protein n=1 Tax=Aspergillus pseudoustus TaxID=1810923 RepID=A0ABR4KRD3_9EURO